MSVHNQILSLSNRNQTSFPLSKINDHETIHPSSENRNTKVCLKKKVFAVIVYEYSKIKIRSNILQFLPTTRVVSEEKHDRFDEHCERNLLERGD